MLDWCWDGTVAVGLDLKGGCGGGHDADEVPGEQESGELLRM